MSIRAWNDGSSNSTGEAFAAEPTVTAIPVGDPYQGQSMGGNNTISAKPSWTESGSGSHSEASSLVVDESLSDFGNVTDVATALGSEPGGQQARVRTWPPK
jgi:hypothetical protein